MKKNILISIIAVLINCLGATASIIDAGKLGDNISWTLSDNGVMTFSGTGTLNLEYRFASRASVVIIKEGISGIGDGAFGDCHDLKSVSIPKSVTSIGSGAFFACIELASINIPKSVSHIGDAVFFGCMKLTSLKVETGNPVYDSRNNCNAIIETASNKIIAGTNKTIIPISVTSIGDCAFSGYSAKTLTIPDNITHIGKWAFSESDMETIIISNSVTSIGENAFYSCQNITSIAIPNSVTSLGDSAFSDCWGLKSITIPNSISTIGNMVFWNCHNLTTVTIPNSVTSIGNGAFFNCKSLTSITIPSSVTSIGEDAFSGCLKLSSIKVEPGNPVYDSRGNCNAIIETASNKLVTGTDNTIIPSSVTSIGQSAFKGLNLTSVIIPTDVTSIGDYAFEGCTGLTSLEIPNSVTSIGDYAFEGCSGLTSPVYNAHVFAYMPTSYSGAYTIPDGIESIAGSAFSGCRGLNSVTIPNSVTSIGNGAFRYCNSLKSITIPNSVKNIGASAFHFCEKLTSISIPDGVKYIEYGICKGCSNLTSVSIPNSVTSIGEDAFSYCKSLSYIIIPASIENIGSDAFSYCPALSIVLPHWFSEKVSFYNCKNVSFYHPEDDELWRMAKNENTEESYKKYLRLSETKKHSEDANKALNRIYSSPEWIEANMWKNVINSNESKEYQAYLSKYPKGKHASDAKKWLWDNDEDWCWQNFVLKYEKIEPLDTYIQKYPTGKYRTLAEERKETIIWEHAKKKNSVESYNNYLEKYPQGRYVAEAIKQKSAAEDRKLWKETIEDASLSAYKRYAETSGAYLNEAKEIIAEMERNGESYNYVVNVGPRDQKVFYDMFLRYPCGNKALSWKYNFGKLKSIAKKEGMLNSVNDKDKDRFLCNTEYNHISVHHYSKPDRIEIFGSYKNIFGVSKITVLVERLAKIGVVWGNNTPDLYGKYKGTYLYEDINVNIELSENNVIVYALKKR